MPGILCCFGHASSHDANSARGLQENKDLGPTARDTQTLPIPAAVPTQPVYPANDTEPSMYNGIQTSQLRVTSPTVSPSHPINTAHARADAGDFGRSTVQGLQVQRKITSLQGHWWTRMEDAVDLLVKTYSAACVSVWILDESNESFVALLSKGPMRQAVQSGYALHLGSEYGANSPSSLTSLWETKAPVSYSIDRPHSSNSSASLHGRAPFPADWMLLYNAHHFTDFLALPIHAASTSVADRGFLSSHQSLSGMSGGVLLGTPEGTTTVSANSIILSPAAATTSVVGHASEVGAGRDGLRIVGAVTFYFSRPDRVLDLPSIFSMPMEQELIVLALVGVLFSTGPEPLRQICELVLAVQSAAGSGELAAAVAAGLTARLQHAFAVAPAALLALVPPKQVSAVVFRDQTAAALEAAVGGATDSMAGYSSSQTLPLLHPALASVAGGGAGAAATYSGSHSHGGGLRVQYRAAGFNLGLLEASGAGSVERSPSLLGTGLRGDGAGANTAIPEIGGAGTSRLCIQNSRSMGIFAGHNPSGLLSCRLDRLPSRYKALVYPLSHTLLQVVLQQRQEGRQAQPRGGLNSTTSAIAAAGGARQTSALRDLCMSAAAAAAPPSGAALGGWIVNDCNEQLHAVHSPSRDIYVMTRVHGRRPHSLVLATAELTGLGGIADAGGEGAGNGKADGGTTAGSNATHIALYMAFPERLPRPLLELVLTDVQMIMRRLLAPLIRHRFETSLAEEWIALAGAANNLPSPGGPVLRITSSMSASQARHAPASLLLPLAQQGLPLLETSPSAGAAFSSTPTIAEGQCNTWLSRVAGGGTTSPSVTFNGMGLGGGAGGGSSLPTNELQMEGLSAGEALQQMSVLVSSYMDTLQAMQGQLMASDRIAESLRREDLPHLQLLEVLGHGGGGVVFRGKLHALEVAVKVFEVPGDLATAAGLPQQSQSRDATTPAGAVLVAGTTAASVGGDGKQQSAWPAVGDRRVLQRSALELAVTASLSHPHIVQVYSLYTNMVLVKQKPPRQGTSGVQLLELSAATALSRADEGIPCSALCMEYCDMGTLAHAIDQHRFMTVTPLGTRRPALKVICTTLLEVALALRHLHARNLAHCDLKPANVLLKSSRRDTRGFTCKLADFGYVSVLKPTVPGGRPSILPEEACGTVTHMAPETFIKGQPLDFSVDTFSFGILMWELYMCARPYSDVLEDQIAQRVTLKGLRPTFPSDTPRSYGALARQCWSQDPNERPSASETVAVIENMLQIMSTQLPAIPPLKPKAPAVVAAAAGSGGGPSSDRAPASPVTAAMDKSVPVIPRARGSLNGGVVQPGFPQGQSPLGRAPASPMLTKVTGQVNNLAASVQDSPALPS